MWEDGHWLAVSPLPSPHLLRELSSRGISITRFTISDSTLRPLNHLFLLVRLQTLAAY